MPLFGDEVRAWARWKEGARGAAAAPRGISSWMHGMRCSLTGFPCAPSGSAKHLAVPAACGWRGQWHVRTFCPKSSRPVVCAKGTFYLVSVGLCRFISCSVLGDQGLFLSMTFTKCS